MTPEAQVDDNLETILSKKTLAELSCIDPEIVSLFFTRLVVDRQAANSSRFAFINKFNHSHVVNTYTQHFINNGFYNRCLERFLASYSGFDESALDELVLFAIWRSLYIFPWATEGIVEGKVRHFIYSSVGFFIRTSYQNNDGRRSDDYPTTLSASINAARVDTLRPVENKIIAQQEGMEIAAAFLNLRTRVTASESKRQKLFGLLLEGLSVSEACLKLRIKPTTAFYWVKLCREAFPEFMIDRVEVRSDGEWVWDRHTAKVILESSQSNLLSTAEIKNLRILLKYGTVKAVVAAKVAHEHNFYTILYQIKVKVQSNGNKTKGSEFSRVGRRRNLIQFLRTVNQNNPADKQIIQTLLLTQGNITRAAALLNQNEHYIGIWLHQKGYYKG